MSNNITSQSQNHFGNQEFDAYGSCIRSNNAFPEGVGVFPSIQSMEDRMPRSLELVQSPVLAEGSRISHTRHLMDILGAASENSHQTQCLSLSLASHMFVSSEEYRQRSFNPGLMSPDYFIFGEEARESCNPGGDHLTSDYSFTSSSAFASSSTSLNRSASTSCGTESFAAIGNSKYLKPVQSLLEELVDVGGNVVDRFNEKYVGKLFNRRLSAELKAELCNNGHLLAKNHELQVKVGKLIALLDEVEGRYEKYYDQMEEIVSSFQMIAGLGSATCYTGLAFQAMSRHFCSLRNATMSQINVEKKRLLQDLPKISSGLSRLSLFDGDIRQSRMSLQQLGLIQSQRQVWRPIRGLPETSVAILRSWLFEHFLRPYPNDSEKLMLASQTGLTKNQVSNWFINARVRLWKPMIEEMYKEEFGDSSEDSNPPVNNHISREDTADTDRASTEQTES